MIELVGVVKAYPAGNGKIAALGSISLALERGEYLTVMGPSGSGKSTLLNILGTLDRPTSGSYLLEGVDITQLSDKQISRVRNRHFGFIFQNYNLLPEFTAIENVMMPLMYAGVPRRDRRPKAVELLNRVSMEHRMGHYPAQLSGGEQQRVAIARALANLPTLLLADEPTGNLPSSQTDGILGLFDNLSQAGMTIVIVTHDPRVGERGHRVLRLADGLIVTDGGGERVPC